MSRTQTIVKSRIKVFEPVRMILRDKHLDNDTIPLSSYDTKLPPLATSSWSEISYLKSGPHVEDVPLVKPLGVNTDPFSSYGNKSPSVANEVVTELITICSTQADLTCFTPMGPLQEVTVLELKMFVLKTFPKLGSHVDDVDLIYSHKPLDINSDPLSRYGIKSWALIWIRRKEQITISSSQGEIGYFIPKGSLLKVTVQELKMFVWKTFLNSASSVNDVRLSYEGKPLDDNTAPLSRYRIKPHVVVQMMIKVQGG